MKIKGLNEYDIVNYKLPAMFIVFPSCTFKCDKDCGRPVCQNSALAKESVITINTNEIIKRYQNNPLTKAIVCGGLEPMDSFDQLVSLINNFRQIEITDPIIVYTGYNKDEIKDKILYLEQNFKNIIVKFGRFVPDQESHYDEVLGVNLASPNQYAEVIS